jgi:putative transposase
VIVLNERHLRAVLAEFAAYYNAARPHRTLDLETPQPARRPRYGPIRASPVLGGLHHTYERAAWARRSSAPDSYMTIRPVG